MRVKYAIAFLLIALTANPCLGQEPVPRKDRLQQLEVLLEQGRQCYVDIGDYSQLKQITEDYKKILDQGFADGMLTLNDKEQLLLDVKYHKLCGDTHYLNTDKDDRSYDSAAAHFTTALQLIEGPRRVTTQDAYHYRFVLHEEFGQLYYKLGAMDWAYYDTAYLEMKEAARYASPNDIEFLSQLAICEARVGKFESAIEDIDMVIQHYPDKKSESYGEALRKKAKILMLQQEKKDTGMGNTSDEAIRCYKEYYALKKADALRRLGQMTPQQREAYWMRLRPFIVDCYRTEDADPAFLYDVTLFGKSLLLEYAQKGKPQSFTWKQVQQKLQPNDCAVEFIQYEKFGEKQLGALVLRKQGPPSFVWINYLYNVEVLQPKNGEGNTLYQAVTGNSSYLKDCLYNDSTLFTYIWTPELLTAIGKDTHRLYFAADGLFHNLAIEYMLPDMPELTSLKSENLYRLTSTRQLLAQSNPKRNGKLLLGGGIDFYGASQNPQNNEADYSNDERAYQFLKSKKARFDLIDGTKAEIDSIYKLYNKNDVTIITDKTATETHVVALIQQHSNVHLATHGFFFGVTPEGTDLLPASYDESLSHSGIALTGSSSTLTSDDFAATQHDGILSAREIAQMDFSNVDLIVLSACQTALGYMTDDGIYGLQRSLKNAGVKSMILSLWSVDDEATAALMQAFHRHLQTEDTHTAFMHAREELIKTDRKHIGEFDPERLVFTKTESSFNHPYFYNAFILIDIK